MTLSSRHRIRNSSLTVWGRARYLSATEAPQNTDFHTWMGKKHLCFFQTAETGNRTPNSGVKGSGANHYPRAPALWPDTYGETKFVILMGNGFSSRIGELAGWQWVVQGYQRVQGYYFWTGRCYDWGETCHKNSMGSPGNSSSSVCSPARCIWQINRDTY